jgi:site-specific DNA recombinase
MTTTKQGVLYARVSSKDQEKEGFSIPAQLKLLREYALKNGIQILREFVDVETAWGDGSLFPAAPGMPRRNRRKD